MNVYAHRTPTVPDKTVKNISARLVAIINGSDINETQGGRLLEDGSTVTLLWINQVHRKKLTKVMGEQINGKKECN